MMAPALPPNRTNRMTMKLKRTRITIMIITMIIIIMMTHLPSIQPDLVAAPQQPRQVNRARKLKTTREIMISRK